MRVVPTQHHDADRRLCPHTLRHIAPCLQQFLDQRPYLGQALPAEVDHRIQVLFLNGHNGGRTRFHIAGRKLLVAQGQHHKRIQSRLHVVKEKIAQKLKQEQVEKAATLYVDNLKKGAKVEKSM